MPGVGPPSAAQSLLRDKRARLPRARSRALPLPARGQPTLRRPRPKGPRCNRDRADPLIRRAQSRCRARRHAPVAGRVPQNCARQARTPCPTGPPGPHIPFQTSVANTLFRAKIPALDYPSLSATMRIVHVIGCLTLAEFTILGYFFLAIEWFLNRALLHMCQDLSQEPQFNNLLD